MSQCLWNNPGANPYRGADIKIKEALARYDFPQDVQNQLYNKIRSLDLTASIEIKNNSIEAFKGNAYNLRDMHFGKSELCRGPVIRNEWKPEHVEKALVYCVSENCVAVPTVCGNISRIDYVPREPKPMVAIEHDGFKFWEGNIPLQHNSVPEPSTLALVMIAVLFLFKHA